MANNLDAYRVFHCVAECGNMTIAAEKLFMNQSTVSRVIQGLEHSLDCRLLQRSTKGVQLTAEGVFLHKSTKDAIAQIEKAEKSLRRQMSKQKKIVKIGASELTMSFFLQPYIKKFRALYQDIVVRMACTDPKSLLDEILSGVYDIGVLGTPIVYDERFAYRNLCELEYILAAGSSFHEIGKEAQSLSALPKYPLITMIENFSVRKYAEKLFSDNGIDVEWSIVVGSLPLLISMIKNNFGIGFLPKVYIQNALDDGSAFEIRLREALPKEHICFIRQRNSPEHGPGKQFIELLVQGTE